MAHPLRTVTDMSPFEPTPVPSLDQLEFAVVDLETTGLVPSEHHILQIGVVVSDSTGRELGSWNTFVKPPGWPFAKLGPRNVHGISNAQLWRAPRLDRALRRLAELLEGRVFTAHNVDFDLTFLDHDSRAHGVALPDSPVVCTLSLSRSLDPSFSRSHRLGDLCTHYGITLERAHDALEDARATSQLLPHLIGESGVSSSAELFERSAPRSRQRRKQD